MPIQYERDDRRRLITVTPGEPYSLDELLNHIDQQWAEHTWEYAVLYDGRVNGSVHPANELQHLVDRMYVVGGWRPSGPVGIAIPQRPGLLREGLRVAALSGPLRNLEILLTEAQVEAWLVRYAPRRRSPDES
jgi:hypothetical protein